MQAKKPRDLQLANWRLDGVSPNHGLFSCSVMPDSPVDPWPHQPPLSKEFFRQKYWSGLSSFSKGSSRFRDWTLISCVFFVGRQSLYHCVTWEALYSAFFFVCFSIKSENIAHRSRDWKFKIKVPASSCSGESPISSCRLVTSHWVPVQ